MVAETSDAQACEPDGLTSKVMPGTFGLVTLKVKSEEQHARDLDSVTFAAVKGSPEGNRRASFVYLVVGLMLSAVSLWGFTPAIYYRLSTGQWWRDPVNIRVLALPPEIDLIVSAHSVAGMLWLIIIILQIVTGAACQSPSKMRDNLRAIHRWLGHLSPRFAYAFFFTCGGTLLAGFFSEDIGKGWNTLFIRSVQFFAVCLAFLLYLLGLYHATGRRFALHKDCMFGSVLFALVPTGVPRFGRDLLQWSMGSECNVSTSPELWFFLCCIYCIFGWPLLFVLSRRYWENAAFPLLLRINGVLVFGLLLLFRPSLHIDRCFYDSFFANT